MRTFKVTFTVCAFGYWVTKTIIASEERIRSMEQCPCTAIDEIEELSI